VTKPICEPPPLTERPPLSDPGHPAALVEFRLADDMGPAGGRRSLADDQHDMPAGGRRSLEPASPAMGRSLAQILIVLVVLLVLVNIPLNSLRAGLAQLVPHNSAMVIRDGLLLQGSGADVYVLQDYKLRLISSPEAFRHYFDVPGITTVEDSFLEQFGRGQPVRLLARCQDSPTVYALENGRKRWVKDPPPTNQASVWDRIELVPCGYLHDLPAGPPIPEDAGLPPQP
jgi:hypothetical protein